jgi:hypothetical protein
MLKKQQQRLPHDMLVTSCEQVLWKLNELLLSAWGRTNAGSF